MQSMDCVNGYSLHSTEFLGVCVRGDTDAHDGGKKRFESRRSVFVFALPCAFDLGSGTHDWPLVSISSGLSFASDYFSTYTNGMAVVEAQEWVPNAWFEDTRDFVARLLRADGLCIPATRGRPGRSDATDIHGLFKANIRDFLWSIYPVFCDQSNKY
jgi:hypothetical protein